MALHSHMVPIGTRIPDVSLRDREGAEVKVRELVGGQPVLVAFLANHCPYVQHVEHELGRIADEYGDSVTFVGVSSNDLDNYPADGPDGMRDQAERAGWRFEYLLDQDQQAAKDFNAACTPDFFLYDETGTLVYRGAMDASSPKNGEVNDGHLLREALSLAVNGQSVPQPHRPSMGCGIKWKPGNEPPAVNFG